MLLRTFHCSTYGALTPRMTIWDPDVLKQIQIKEFSTFPDRQVGFQREIWQSNFMRYVMFSEIIATTV